MGKIKHGHSIGGWTRRSSTYNRWSAMKARCFNPLNKDFKDYAARGITVCERWLVFEHFLADMGEAPAGMWLEREDNDKGYYLNNCCWATPRQQQRNRRDTRRITFRGQTMCLTAWAEHLGINRGTLKSRFRYGWSVQKAFTFPIREWI